MFLDVSSGIPDSWSWSFGDGSTSITRNATHTYTSAGAFTVTLTAANGSVADTKSVPGYVTVTSSTTPLVANFAGTPRLGTVPLTVSFSDASAGLPVIRSWSFGDGGVSIDQNPTHTYTETGTYTVSLTAVNGTITDTITRSGYVTVSAVPAVAGDPVSSVSSDSDSFRSAETIPMKPPDISLKVDSGYLREHKVVPADIVIMCYRNDRWEALPTTFVSSSGNDFYFTAHGEQYSLLAVGNTRDGVGNLPLFSTVLPPAETSLSPDNAIVPSTPRTGEQKPISPILPSPEKTTAPSIPLQETAGFDTFSPAFVAVSGIGLVTGGIMIRRWWIRRQNPALFREYD
jgi:hypothetical protein